jgi:hypothetical protein
MKRRGRKILALIMAFAFLWMGWAPAFASFGDTCCGYHRSSDSLQNDHSGPITMKNQSCGCGGNNPRPACSDRSVGQASYRGHPIMKRVESMTQMLSYLFEELNFGGETGWSRPSCCDIEKAPGSSAHETPVFFTPSRLEKQFFVVKSKIPGCPGGPSRFGCRPPLVPSVLARTSRTPIYLDNNTFLI